MIANLTNVPIEINSCKYLIRYSSAFSLLFRSFKQKNFIYTYGFNLLWTAWICFLRHLESARNFPHSSHFFFEDQIGTTSNSLFICNTEWFRSWDSCLNLILQTEQANCPPSFAAFPASLLLFGCFLAIFGWSLFFVWVELWS